MSTITDRINRLLHEIRGVAASYGITSWERDRLDEWRYKRDLSDRQEKVLQELEKKVFGEQEEEDDV